MTRKGQIEKEAKKFAKEIDDWEIAEDVQDAFEQGAQWADEHPNWVSVEEELPNDSDDKLVALDNGRLSTDFWNYVDGHWEGYCCTEEHVTHWMPLPKPPKKGGEE